MRQALATDPEVVRVQANFPGIAVDLPNSVQSVAFRVVDTGDSRWFIKADLDGDRLTFNVVTVDTANPTDRSTIRAGTFFAAAMEWFAASSIQEIYLQWFDTPGIDTNFLAFLAACDPNTDNREAAVMATPSYKIISRSPWHFSTIHAVTLDPGKPRRFAKAKSGRSVTVTCTR